jgi:hypothetical protein
MRKGERRKGGRRENKDIDGERKVESEERRKARR